MALRFTPWLAGVPLTALDRAQLLAVMQLFTPALTEAEMLAGDTRFFGTRVQQFAECPVEWWDLGDDQPRFQLWICSADAGYLLDAGGTTLCANIIQWDFDIDELLPADVRREIAEAAAIAVAAAPVAAGDGPVRRLARKDRRSGTRHSR